MTRPTSTIACALALATAVNVTAIGTQAETPRLVTAWLTYVTSGHHGEVQHLITARYDAPDIEFALADCRRDARQFMIGIKKEADLTLVVPPSCATAKPPWWID